MKPHEIKKTPGRHSIAPIVVQQERLYVATGPSVETRSSTGKSRKIHVIIIVILYLETSAALCRHTKYHIGRKTLKQ